MADKIPGVGLISSASDRVKFVKRPVGCPQSVDLNPDRSPWRVIEGLDPYRYPSSRDPIYEQFHTLITETIAGGLYSTASPNPCWAGGTAGGDPHGVMGRSVLPILCQNGPIPEVISGSPETHTGIPTEEELLFCRESYTVWGRVYNAYRLLSEEVDDEEGEDEEEGEDSEDGDNVEGEIEQCSKGWICDPMPSSDYPERRRGEGWKVIEVDPESRAPMDCYQESTKGFGKTLYYVDSPRCRGLDSTEPPSPPEPPIDPPPPIDPVDPVDPPVDPPVLPPVTELEEVLDKLDNIYSLLQSIHSTSLDHTSRLKQLESQHREMDRRNDKRHGG